MKKIISVALCLVIVFGTIAVGGDSFVLLDIVNVKTSATQIGQYGIFDYRIENNLVAITGCDSEASGEIIIPSEINGMVVNEIERIEYCEKITKIIIPSTVKKLCSLAFYNCSGLKSVIINEGLKELDGAFSDCEKLSEIILPNSIETIGHGAFSGTAYYNNASNWENGVLYIGNYLIAVDSSVKGNVTIKNGTIAMSERAFYGHKELTSITIPDSLVSISDYAFMDCKALSKIVLGKSVKSIGYDSFDNCDNIEEIHYTGTIAEWCNIDFIGNIMYSSYKGKGFRTLYINNKLLTRISKSDLNGVKHIPYKAFRDCTSLEEVSIPDNVIEIGWEAFYGTPFYNDSSNWIDGSLYINNALIKGESIIKEGTKVIAENAFDSTPANNIVIPNSVKYINSDAFYSADNLTNIVLPNSVVSLGEGAFSYCSSLKNIVLSEKLIVIGEDAFWGCHSLKFISIPDSVLSIGEDAFTYCESMESIRVGKGVSKIDPSVFNGCSNLSSIKVSSQNEVFHSSGNCIINTINKELVAGCYNSFIPDDGSVINIGTEAFYNIDSLTSIFIPKCITSISNDAFSCCYSLKDVYYQGSKEDRDNINTDLWAWANRCFRGAQWHYNVNAGELEKPLCFDDIKIMSYNVYVEDSNVVGKTNGVTYDCHYTTRLKQVEANIMNNLPDSIGLQEVSKDIKTILENNPDINGNSMGDLYAFVGEFRDKDRIIYTGHNNEASLIAYRKDKYKLKDSGTRWLSESGKKYSKHSKAEYKRVFTWALLEDNYSKQQYLHINTHVEHTQEDGNVEASVFSAAQIIDFVKTTYPDIPVVLTGDFNHTKSSQMYKDFIHAGFVDTNINNDSTYTYTNCFNQGKKKNGVMDAFDPNTIDFILVKNGFENGINSYTVYNEDYTNSLKYGNNSLPYPYASDHHPIISNLTWSYKETATTNSSFTYTTESGHSSTNNIKYDSKWFKNDNKQYNHELAQFCSNFAMMGYTGEKNKAQFINNLQNLGFSVSSDDVDFKNGQVKDPGRDEINYFIANKKENIEGEIYTIVFAGFIGSDGYQWYSNFDPLGYENKNQNKSLAEGVAHRGFADARDYAMGKLQAYINNLKVDTSKIKLVITGHSRGAATANLLAAKIIDNGKPALSSNIYTYTFATPNTALMNSCPTDNRYSCIFNIVNPEDFVTKVMLHNWGFGRYGVTYTLPSKTNDKYYSERLERMRPLFLKYTGQTYTPYAGGEKSTYKVINNIYKKVKNINEFYNKRFSAYSLVYSPTPFQLFKDTLVGFVSKKDIPTALANIDLVFKDPFPDTFYRSVLGYFFDLGVTGQLSLNFAHSHQMETYNAYMQTLTSSLLTQNRSGYKGSVNCPVDIKVYDTDTEELVGEITNNVVDESVASEENAVVMTVTGDSKEFWIPSNGNYRVVLTGNDNGTMDYTVAETDSDKGETNRVNFFDVKVQKGNSSTSNFDENFNGLESLNLIKSDGAEIASTENIEDESKEHKINVSVEGFGYASESRIAVSGDYVSLTAEAIEGTEFIGWYENNKLVSSDVELSFVAKSSRNLTAKFKSKTYIVTWNVEGVKTTQPVDFGFKITKPVNPVKKDYTFKGWTPEIPTIMPANNLTFTAMFEKNNLTKDAKLIVKSGEVYNNSKVTIMAKATGVPDGYVLAIYDGGKNPVAKGDNTSVKYEIPKEVSSTKTLMVKVIDKDGNVQKDANGKDLSENIEIKVKSGFFNAIIAFFKKLFGSNKVTIEP